jgi:predicted  nucleic acid-binding Zn-ribbon protein
MGSIRKETMDSVRKFHEEMRVIEAFDDGLNGKLPPETVASYEKALSEDARWLLKILDNASRK